MIPDALKEQAQTLANRLDAKIPIIQHSGAGSVSLLTPEEYYRFGVPAGYALIAVVISEQEQKREKARQEAERTFVPMTARALLDYIAEACKQI